MFKLIRLRRLTVIITFLISYQFLFSSDIENDSLLKVFTKSKDVQARIGAYGRLTYLMCWKNTDSASIMFDSLFRWTSREGDATEKCKLINYNGNLQWFKGNYDSALTCFQLYRSDALKNNLPVHYQRAISNIGLIYSFIGMLDSARVYLNESLLLSLKNSDSTAIVKSYLDMGSLYNKLNYQHLALKYLQLVSDYYVRKSDSVKAAMAFMALGSAYQKIKNFDKSRDYYNKSLSYDQRLKNIDYTFELYNNLGLTYLQVKTDFDSSRYFFLKSKKYLDESGGNSMRYFTFLTNVGGLEVQAKNFQIGMKYLLEARSMKLPYQDNFSQSALLINLGYAYFKTGQMDSARVLLNDGLNLAMRNGANIYIKNAYKNIYLLDSAQGNWPLALIHYQKSRDYQDTIDNESVRTKIAELEIIYDSEKKQKENLYLKTQNSLNEKVIFNQRLILIISLSSLTIIFIFLIFILIKHRQLKFVHEQLRIKGEELRKKQEEIEIKNKSLEIQKEELTELNQTKDKIFSIIAHDLRSPFNALLGFLDMLENEFDEMNDEEKLTIIKKLHLGSENTYNLLINLLDWSRSQRGLIQNNPEYFDLQQITNLAIEVLANRAAKKEHTIENQIEPLVRVFADPNLLEQILINLINNSIKFTPRNGRIIISVEKSEQFVSIFVKDTGIGIPESKIEEIFSLSSGFNRKGTENELGTGLGLNLCREYIHLMGGNITIQSMVERGTTFKINIPAVEPESING